MPRRKNSVIVCRTSAVEYLSCRFVSIGWTNMDYHLHTNLRAIFAVGLVIVGTLGCGDSESPTNALNTTSPPGMPDSAVAIPDVDSASKQISAVVEVIFRSINDGAFENLYESATAPKFREVASLEKFTAICKRVQSRLGSLLSKQSSRFELNPIADGVVASTSYQAKFEHGTGTISVIFEKAGDQWLLLKLNVNAPELLDDPTQYRERVELLVVDSEPVLPGATVDVVDPSIKPPRVLVENVTVLNVRWKVADPSSKLQFPASGFVTLSLSKDAMKTVDGVQTLSVQKHTGVNSAPDGQN